MEEIKIMETWEGAQLNQAKIILADEATKLLHGSECLDVIHETTKALFTSGGGSNLDSLPTISLDEELISKINQVDSVGVPVIDVMIIAELATSKNEAKKAINNGGVRINDVKVETEKAVITKTDFNSENKLKLSLGKKKHLLISL